MAELPSGFDPDKIIDETIPAGWYPMELIDNEWKDVKENSEHKYINCQLKIVGPDYNGTVIWLMLQLINGNPKTVNIANKDSNRMLVACGKPNSRNLDDIQNIIFEGKVTVQKANANWPAKNEVKGFRPYEGSVTVPDGIGASEKSETKTEKDVAKKKLKPWEAGYNEQ